MILHVALLPNTTYMSEGRKKMPDLGSKVQYLTNDFNFILTDLLTIVPHTPTPEPVKFDKTDGQWYTHDGVDVKETQQRRGISWLTSSFGSLC